MTGQHAIRKNDMLLFNSAKTLLWMNQTFMEQWKSPNPVHEYYVDTTLPDNGYRISFHIYITGSFVFINV